MLIKHGYLLIFCILGAAANIDTQFGQDCQMKVEIILERVVALYYPGGKGEICELEMKTPIV